MTTSTFYGAMADGLVRSWVDSWYGQTWSQCVYGYNQNTTDPYATNSTYLRIGSRKYYTDSNQWKAWQSFVAFYTSVLPDGDTVSSATFGLYGYVDSSSQDFTIQARSHDWDTTVTTDDWRNDTNGYGTLLATYATSGGWSTSAYNDFTSESTFPSYINKTGQTRFYIVSNRLTTSTEPTLNVDEYVDAWSGDSTSQDPRLVVVHSAGGVTEDVLQAAESDAGIGMATFGHPENLIATVISENRVDLTWNAVTGATAYEVFRDGTYLDTVGTESYSDQAISSHSHRWQVRTVI